MNVKKCVLQRESAPRQKNSMTVKVITQSKVKYKTQYETELRVLGFQWASAYLKSPSTL